MPTPPKRNVINSLIDNDNFNKLLNLPTNAIIEISGDNAKEQANEKINLFKENLKASSDIIPNYLISADSWKRLLNGIDATGTCWLKEYEEVHGFVFCIAFVDNKIPYFRIRTVVLDKRQFIENPSIGIGGVGNKIINTSRISIETNNIAYADFQNAKSPLGLDSVIFIDYNSSSFSHVNDDVRNFKTRGRGLFKNFKVPMPETGSHNEIQEGLIFSSKCTFLNYLKDADGNIVKGSKVSFGWEKESITFVLHINPYGYIDGIKCPSPTEGCNFSS